MVAALLALKSLLMGVEFVDMTPGPTTTKYKAKMTGAVEPIVRARVVVNSILDLPPRIPTNLRVEKGEKGAVLKDFKIHWDVRAGMRSEIPKPRELINDTVKAITGG